MQITINGESKDTQLGATIAQLLAQLELPAEQVAVEVNLDLIPRAQHESFTLNPNDQVEIVRLVGGG